MGLQISTSAQCCIIFNSQRSKWSSEDLFQLWIYFQPDATYSQWTPENTLYYGLGLPPADKLSSGFTPTSSQSSAILFSRSSIFEPISSILVRIVLLSLEKRVFYTPERKNRGAGRNSVSTMIKCFAKRSTLTMLSINVWTNISKSSGSSIEFNLFAVDSSVDLGVGLDSSGLDSMIDLCFKYDRGKVQKSSKQPRPTSRVKRRQQES